MNTKKFMIYITRIFHKKKNAQRSASASYPSKPIGAFLPTACVRLIDSNDYRDVRHRRLKKYEKNAARLVLERFSMTFLTNTMISMACRMFKINNKLKYK